MAQTPAHFDPFWAFRWPLSGDVNQRIVAPWFSPTVNVNYAGDPVIEDRVVTDVASYGRQLGWLSEIVIELAKNKPAPSDTLEQLEVAAEKIAEIKKQRQKSVRERADEALDRLEREQPTEYKRLLRDRRKQDE